MRRMTSEDAQSSKAHLEGKKPVFKVVITQRGDEAYHLRLENDEGRCVMTVVMLPQEDREGYLDAVASEANKRAIKTKRR